MSMERFFEQVLRESTKDFRPNSASEALVWIKKNIEFGPIYLRYEDNPYDEFCFSYKNERVRYHNISRDERGVTSFRMIRDSISDSLRSEEQPILSCKEID